jgi:hypothetical protein
MEEQNVTPYSAKATKGGSAEINAIKAQKFYDTGREVISKMERTLVFANFGDKDACNIFVATERSKANDHFLKSKDYIKRVLNDHNADEVTKKSVLDIEKKIDAIPWASK